VETGSSRWIFSSAATCSSIVVWFFETVRLMCDGLFLSMLIFAPLLLFVDVVFPWFVYANITSETVALDTPNSVKVFVNDAPAKRATTIYILYRNRRSFLIFRFCHTACHSTQSLMHLHGPRRSSSG
jgi:hypothetical protein